MNSGMHTEYLHPPDQNEVSPMTRVIEDLFQHELSGHNWKKLSLDELNDLIADKVKIHNIASNDRHFILLKRRLKECKSVEEFILGMGDYILGKSL